MRLLSMEKDYFQRLHRAAQGSIREALFHWLRCAEFVSKEGALLVQPIEPLPSLAGALDLEQSFALKALLDHGTLTVDEYAEVARVSLEEARHTFRTMREMEVIEATAKRRERYRIRPLMTGPVTAHLRSRNILHADGTLSSAVLG